MTSLAQTLRTLLPGLRRYAIALAGSRCAGDYYVRETLETLVEDPRLIHVAEPSSRHLRRDPADVRFQLYRLFHEVVRLSTAAFGPSGGAETFAAAGKLRRKFNGLPLRDRELVLLVMLERFSFGDAARLLHLSAPEARHRFGAAKAQLRETMDPPRPYAERRLPRQMAAR